MSILAAWWEGWKAATNSFQRESSKPRVNPQPSHQVSSLAAWWEGWKVSAPSQLFSWSSFIILFYSLILFYTLSESLLYSMPAVYDLSNPCDLPSLHHYLTPTGSMGGWVKAPGSYSSIPKAPPWQCSLDLTGSWSTQDSAISQRSQRIISKQIFQSISTTYTTQFIIPKNLDPGSRVRSMVFQDPVRIFDPG